MYNHVKNKQRQFYKFLHCHATHSWRKFLYSDTEAVNVLFYSINKGLFSIIKFISRMTTSDCRNIRWSENKTLYIVHEIEQ